MPSFTFGSGGVPQTQRLCGGHHTCAKYLNAGDIVCMHLEINLLLLVQDQEATTVST